MRKNRIRNKRRSRRKTGIRKRIFGTPERPRLSVYRSSKHMYAQIIDDLAGHTLVAASTVQTKPEKTTTVDAAQQVGVELARMAKQAGIEQVAFDRNGFRYHGRIRALADAAREGGLQF